MKPLSQQKQKTLRQKLWDAFAAARSREARCLLQRSRYPD
jgi:hypothetical protein